MNLHFRANANHFIPVLNFISNRCLAKCVARDRVIIANLYWAATLSRHAPVIIYLIVVHCWIK